MDHAPTAAEIRGHAGELHGIRIPAKFASRLGLCFSSTYATCDFRPDEICTLPDVKTPRGGILTDGVGVITTEGLKKVIDALPVSKQKIGHKAGDVSAIQVRIGGCKGVLARWDNLTCVPPRLLPPAASSRHRALAVCRDVSCRALSISNAPK